MALRGRHRRDEPPCAPTASPTPTVSSAHHTSGAPVNRGPLAPAGQQDAQLRDCRLVSVFTSTLHTWAHLARLTAAVVLAAAAELGDAPSRAQAGPALLNCTTAM
jgi:hypothetical protein